EAADGSGQPDGIGTECTALISAAYNQQSKSGTEDSRWRHVPGQLMEEQTAYCSTDENPFYYHTSRRYYRQPYTVESGFYGYTLTTPRTPQHRDFASSSSQTQIGHVFAEHHKSS
ncbi:unnamed protein product, partial [Nippostrongylus brasiliensis]|uniref:Homeobox protein A9 n=1 Tax=Nippostrongylus brasiliensis TaxID=27835 RepID=A0A0N4XJV9_NIPBR